VLFQKTLRSLFTANHPYNYEKQTYQVRYKKKRKRKAEFHHVIADPAVVFVSITLSQTSQNYVFNELGPLIKIRFF
jgi:hypothetical protein